MDVVGQVQRTGGTATRAQLAQALEPGDRAGLTQALEAAVAAGALVRVGRGRWATASAAPGLVAAFATSGVLSGLSAAQWWGWPVKREPSRPEVTVARNRVLRRSDVVVRRRDLPEGAVAGHVLTRAHTVVDVARWCPFDEALCVVDSALREGRVPPAELAAALATVPRTGRVRVAGVVAQGDARAANPFESTTRAIALGVEGLRLEPQGEVPGVGWVDLADHQLLIAVECESWAWHGGQQPFRRDVRRYTSLTRTGWLVARFVWEDVRRRPELVRAGLADLVRLRRSDTRFATVLAARR